MLLLVTSGKHLWEVYYRIMIVISTSPSPSWLPCKPWGRGWMNIVNESTMAYLHILQLVESEH